MGKKELTFKELSPKAKLGFEKFARLPSKKMKEIGEAFEKSTGKRSGDVTQKEEFFRFVKNKRVNR